MRAILLAASASLVASLVVTPLLIRSFRRRGFGQLIREDTEHLHAGKAGTPTMGGAAIVLAALVGYSAARAAGGMGITPTGVLVLATFVGMGAVGFLDDYIKLRMKRNLGLSKTAKFGGQTLIAVAFAFFGPNFGGVRQQLSFVGEFGGTIPLVLFMVWVFVMLAGTSNAVNLTDGLDGLAAGSCVLALAAYTIIAFWQFRNPSFYSIQEAAAFDVAVTAAAVMAASTGFLWWNAPPAQVFMGDTGSLALGGLLAALALVTNTQLLLVVLGGIFVVETLSVIMQVAAFRGFGRRVLRMAPLHHHFEMTGWHETTVIVRFWIVAGVGVGLALGIFYADFLTAGGAAGG